MWTAADVAMLRLCNNDLLDAPLAAQVPVLLGAYALLPATSRKILCGQIMKGQLLL